MKTTTKPRVCKIIIDGRPIPASRMTQKGKWDDRAQRYLAYKMHVGWKAKTAVKELFAGDVSVNIALYLKKKGRAGDVDNYAKAILDGLNKIAFSDDAQVQNLFIRRIYIDQNERAEVTIREALNA